MAVRSKAFAFVLITGMLATTMCAAIMFQVLKTVTATSNQETSISRNTLKQLSIALHSYRERYGTLPYHKKGGSSALYLLKPFLKSNTVPQNCFIWDDKNHEMLCPNLYYFNSPETDHHINSRVILAFNMPDDHWAKLCFAPGLVISYEFSKPPGRSVLGNLLTQDGFIAVGKSEFEAWNSTLPKEGGRSVNVGGKLRNIHFSDCVVEYSYKSNQIIRTTTCDDTQEIDIAKLDSLGRIVAVLNR